MSRTHLISYFVLLNFSLHFTASYGIYGVSGDLCWECDSTFPYRGTLY